MSLFEDQSKIYEIANPYAGIDHADLFMLDRVKPLKHGFYSDVRRIPKISRNSICTCGSGLKYKLCCLKK